MSQAQVFVSYRRDDSAGYARAIGDALARRLGAERVFIDVDDIGAGQSFDRAIDDAVGQARVLLVLIGRRWLASAEGGSGPRLAEPDDFVCHEVATGLARGLQVIPLLVDGATMPTEAQLPESIRPLARRQALVIDHARFAADVQRLLGVLETALGEQGAGAQPSPSGRRRRGLAWGAGAAGLALLAGAGVWWWRSPGHRSDSSERGETGERSDRAGGTAARARPDALPARPAVNGRWEAEVTYPWPNARYVERFELNGEGRALHGSASFLRVARGIVEGEVEADGRLAFVTRTQEQTGTALRELTHRYRGRIDGDELVLQMQTEDASSPGGPVTIRARRQP